MEICQKLGWMVNFEKSELEMWPGPTDTGPVAEPSAKSIGTSILTGFSGLAVDIINRSANNHRKAGSPRPTTYETHTVISQKQLEGTKMNRKGYHYPEIMHPHLKDDELQGQPLHPLKHAL